MISALLIGFGYRGVDELPGTRIDLYQAWKYCHRIGAKQILVVTDLDSDLPATGLLKMVVDDVVDANITTFIHDTKTNQEYRRFAPLEFRQQLRSVAHKLSGSNRLIIYYTGHGIPGFLKLPDMTTMPVTEFRDTLLGSCAASTQVLWIMDCCHASGMDLPYQLDHSKYHLVNPNYSLLPELICLVASTRSQRATSTNKGSIFTRSLFTSLHDGVRSVHRLKHEIDRYVRSDSSAPPITSHLLRRAKEVLVLGSVSVHEKSLSGKSNSTMQLEDPTMTIYSSYPHLRCLWSWVYGSSVQIELDWCDSTIRIQPNPTPSTPLSSPIEGLASRSPLKPVGTSGIQNSTRITRITPPTLTSRHNVDRTPISIGHSLNKNKNETKNKITPALAPHERTTVTLSGLHRPNGSMNPTNTRPSSGSGSGSGGRPEDYVCFAPSR